MPFSKSKKVRRDKDKTRENGQVKTLNSVSRTEPLSKNLCIRMGKSKVREWSGKKEDVFFKL